MGLCQILKRCVLCIEGDRKTPPVAWEWNTPLKPPAQTPIFSAFTPPLDIFSVQVYNYFSTLFILAGGSYDLKNLLKFIILLLRKIEKILHSGKQKICTGGVRAFALPLPKPEAKPFCYLIFPLLAKPTTLQNENNSHLILFHILLVRNIFQQRGRFLWKS